MTNQDVPKLRQRFLDDMLAARAEAAPAVSVCRVTRILEAARIPHPRVRDQTFRRGSGDVVLQPCRERKTLRYERSSGPSSGANVSSTSCARSSMSRTILSRWRRFKLVTCCCSSWSLAPGAETSVRAPWIVSGNSEDADRQWNAPVICDLARGGSSITQTSNVAPPSQIGLGCHGS